jgi:hypothetical protein
VTPQYHYVYDDIYTTVPNGEFAPVFGTEHFAANDDLERLISSGGWSVPTCLRQLTVTIQYFDWKMSGDHHITRWFKFIQFNFSY